MSNEFAELILGDADDRCRFLRREQPAYRRRLTRDLILMHARHRLCRASRPRALYPRVSAPFALWQAFRQNSLLSSASASVRRRRAIARIIAIARSAASGFIFPALTRVG